MLEASPIKRSDHDDPDDVIEQKLKAADRAQRLARQREQT
jgi:hypothetical protein